MVAASGHPGPVDGAGVRLLDAFSCAGIGADGYARAGWEVVCVDNDPKALAHNPHETVLADALTLLADPGFMSEFDAVHASPPCQLFSATRRLAVAQGKGQGRAVDLLTPTLQVLGDLLDDQEWDMPWVVENVPRSPLKAMGAVQLCGSSFGLKVQRHRLFLSNVPIPQPACDHSTFDPDPVTGKPRPWGVYYAKGDNIPSGGRTCLTTEHAMECMGVEREVPWPYLCEALPPAYTEHVGRALLAELEAVA